MSTGDGEWIAACDESALAGNRALVQVPPKTGRYIAVIRHKGSLTAIDATCYHMGGPLLTADIEEVPGFGSCVVCPWHRYEICLDNGQKVYQDMTGVRKTNGEMKQRVHGVRIHDGKVLIQLSTEGKCASDEYAFKRPAPSQVSGGLRSGHIMGGGPQGLNRMISNSMHGGDGAAPWGVPAGPPAVPLPPGTTSNSLFNAAPRGGGVGGSGLLAKEMFSSYLVESLRPISPSHFLMSVRIMGASYSLAGLGRHLELRHQGVTRFYTPYMPNPVDRSSVEFLIKVYPNGELTPHLAGLKQGVSRLELRGPVGGLPADTFAPQQASSPVRLNLLAGGTGVTPFLQMLYHLSEREAKVHSVREAHLLWCVRSHAEAVVPDQLRTLQKRLAGKGVSFTHRYAVASEEEPPVGFEGIRGKVTAEMLRDHLQPASASVGDSGGGDASTSNPPRTVLYVCGPTAFNDCAMDLAKSIGYSPEDVREFA